MPVWFVQIIPIITAIIGGIFMILKVKRARLLTIVISLVSLCLIITLVIITYVTWRPKHSWETWEKDLVSKFETIEGDGYYKLCKAIKDIPPPFSKKSQSGSFYDDMKVGEILLKNKKISEVLKKYFGLYEDSFIGTGLSIPWGFQYSQALSKEYIVPNLNERDNDVWTWELEPAFANYSRLVSDIIKNGTPTSQSNTININQYLEEIISRIMDVTRIPPVIRFQQFPKTQYKGTIGRPDSQYVFFSNLHDTWDMTVEEAAKASGHRLSLKGTSASDTKLFIWLYVPTHAYSVRRATWRNILKILQE